MELRFTVDWFSPNIPEWETHLGPLAGKPDLHFVEVGSLEGRSACWLLQNILTHPSCTLDCVDLFEIGEEHFDVVRDFPGSLPSQIPIEENFRWNIKALGAESKVRMLKGRSEEILRTLALRTYDGAYIDGSHRAPNVLTDLVLTWGLLKEGGMVILDDYEWLCYADKPLLHPKIAIDAFIGVFADECEIMHKGYQMILRKLSRGA